MTTRTGPSTRDNCRPVTPLAHAGVIVQICGLALLSALAAFYAWIIVVFAGVDGDLRAGLPFALLVAAPPPAALIALSIGVRHTNRRKPAVLITAEVITAALAVVLAGQAIGSDVAVFAAGYVALAVTVVVQVRR